jgi:hypothetical protein
MVFNAVDAAGVKWWVTSVEGWRSGAPLRVSLEDRPQRDGSFDAPSFRGSRVVTMMGRAVAPDPVAAELAMYRFKALLADGSGLKPLVAHELANRLRAEVRLSDLPRAELRPGRVEFDFQAVFVAPDPLLYSADLSTFTLTLPATSTLGGMTVPFTVPMTVAAPAGSTGEKNTFNAGTFPTFPTVTIQGPVTDPVLENVTTGRRLRLKYTLASADSLVVDFDNGMVLLNGNTPVGALASGSSFWPLVKGNNLIRYTAFTGASGAPATISYRSAWN